MSDAAMLEMAGVAKRFGARAALAGVDLVARPGEVHGLLGANGAGKTTLLRIALGLARCDSGTLRLMGRPLDWPNGRLPDGVAGFVEAPAFYPYLSGRENLSLLAHLDRRSGVSRVTECLDQVGLASVADAAVSAYSAGMRQRLGLAAALIRHPALLVLDEPTSSLDPAGARDVRHTIAALARDGAAVVFSSHDMAELEDLCSVFTVLHHGRVVFSGVREAFEAHVNRDAYTLQTSNDQLAIEIARECGVESTAPETGNLVVHARSYALDAYVIALGRRGVAVRSLSRQARSLEASFLELTR